MAWTVLLLFLPLTAGAAFLGSLVGFATSRGTWEHWRSERRFTFGTHVVCPLSTTIFFCFSAGFFLAVLVDALEFAPSMPCVSELDIWRNSGHGATHADGHTWARWRCSRLWVVTEEEAESADIPTNGIVLPALETMAISGLVSLLAGLVAWVVLGVACLGRCIGRGGSCPSCSSCTTCSWCSKGSSDEIFFSSPPPHPFYGGTWAQELETSPSLQHFGWSMDSSSESQQNCLSCSLCCGSCTSCSRFLFAVLSLGLQWVAGVMFASVLFELYLP